MSVRGTIRGMAGRANPLFAAAVVVVPLAAFALSATVASYQVHTYVHVMAGVMWTGIDLFMALVIGPVLAGLSIDQRADWFERFTPKMAFLMPTLATVTIFAGITLAIRIGAFPNPTTWIAIFVFAAFVPATLTLGWVFNAFRDRRWQAFFGLVLLTHAWYLASTASAFAMTDPIIVLILAVMVILTVQGFGILMPNEVMIYLEMVSDEPDRDRIGRLGLRNAKLSGVQGVFQLSIIVLMVYLRWGGL